MSTLSVWRSAGTVAAASRFSPSRKRGIPVQAALVAGLIGLVVGGLGLPSAPAPAQAAEPVRVMVWGGQPEIDTYEKILSRFRQEHPNIPVRLEPVPWGQYMNKLQVYIASGTAPDVVLLNGAFIRDLEMQGALVDLDPLIARSKFPLNEYWDTKDILRVNGKFYALPLFGDVAALYYNRTAVEQSGLPAPATTWKWDDLREAARKLTIRAGGQTSRYGVIWDIGGNGQSSYLNFLLQNGVRYLSEDRTHSQLASAPAIAAIRYWIEMIRQDGSAPPPERITGVSQDFLDQKAAMAYHLIPLPINLFQKAKFDWDVVPMPAGPKGRASEVNFIGFGMVAGNKRMDEAWQVLSFLVGEESQRTFASLRQNLPAMRSALANLAFANPQRPPRSLISTLQATMQSPTYDLQFTVGWTDWTNLLGSAMTEIAKGSKPVEVGLREVSDKIDVVLRKARQSR